jgi:hypothetical protein
VGRVPAEVYTATHPGHVAALALLDAIPLNRAVTVAGLNRRNEIATDLQRVGLIPNPLPPVRHNSCLALVKAITPGYALLRMYWPRVGSVACYAGKRGRGAARVGRLLARSLFWCDLQGDDVAI